MISPRYNIFLFISMDCCIFLVGLSDIEFFGEDLFVVFTEANINFQRVERLFVDSVFSQ
jgi:hypothetical protein